MECRSTEKRQWIVETYDVVPVAHIQLLAGQTKHSDAGQIIKNDYYIFEVTDKLNGEKDIIQWGMGAARDFLRLLEHEGLPVFNPLHNETTVGTQHIRKIKSEKSDVKASEKWNPVAAQLYLPNSNLTQAINELRKENNVRDSVCRFDLLTDTINSMTDKDGNLLHIQPMY